jgi:hypothetical protein
MLTMAGLRRRGLLRRGVKNPFDDGAPLPAAPRVAVTVT